ncbi:MAG: hypothetical protein ACRDJW_03685 [Thermomicrobiales bacterium]
MEVPRRRLDLKDEPELISPPIVAEPLYQCAIAVTVLAFLPHAEIDVEVDGVIAVSAVAGFPMPDGETFALPNPLVAGQVVRARQRKDGVQSAWSDGVTVRDHTVDYPAGPPRPEVNPAPVHQCGARTGVSNLLIGCNVWITADGTEVGRVDGAKEHQGVNVNPDYGLGQDVIAWADLCKDPSPPSQTHVTQLPPAPLPTPAFEPIYEGGEQLTLIQLANGARFTLDRDAVNQGTWRTWGQRHHVGLAPPFANGESFAATQRLCPSDPPSGTGTGTVQPCSSLPAPTVAPIQDGDTSVTVLTFVPDATIKVYRNFAEVGEGGGPVVQTSEALLLGDIIHVTQDLAKCEGSTAQEVGPKCVAPHLSSNPAGLNLFPVGFLEYDGGTATIDGQTFSVKGTVFYPSENDGKEEPFYERLAKLGPAPIVFMAHGNHAIFRDPANKNNESCSNPGGWEEIPNHEGYAYFQRQLARMGIIAVAVYSNETNCIGYSATNIHHRAGLIIESIKHFQGLNAGDPIFDGKIDFGRVGLMGHSRGGDAVVTVPEVIGAIGVTIRAVIALAPTDTGASSGAPKTYSFMTILPAGDGDVRRNDGVKFYDQASPDPFKSQLYVHYANHNFFNTEWPEDDGKGPPVMSRADHERVLSAYGCAIFRAALLNHATTGFLVGTHLPSGAPSGNVYLSFEWEKQLDVDHHEDGNGIGVNSQGQGTSQSGGLTADEYDLAQSGSTFNGTFYGNTTGMVAEHKEGMGAFRSPLAKVTDLTQSEIWIRAAEVFDGGSVPTGATGFQLGLEDASGFTAWVDSDAVGGLPRPYDRTADDSFTKTMLNTLRFRAECFTAPRGRFDIPEIRAILLRCNRPDNRALAFDVLQIVKP